MSGLAWLWLWLFTTTSLCSRSTSEPRLDRRCGLESGLSCLHNITTVSRYHLVYSAGGVVHNQATVADWLVRACEAPPERRVVVDILLCGSGLAGAPLPRPVIVPVEGVGAGAGPGAALLRLCAAGGRVWRGKDGRVGGGPAERGDTVSGAGAAVLVGCGVVRLHCRRATRADTCGHVWTRVDTWVESWWRVTAVCRTDREKSCYYSCGYLCTMQ